METDGIISDESELMSVEEYFDIVWHRYIEKQEKIKHGKLI